MKKYDVSVEITRSYVVTVNATSSHAAFQKVERLTADEVDKQGNYVDTFVVVDDEAELSEK
jgi:hypothetical protein